MKTELKIEPSIINDAFLPSTAADDNSSIQVNQIQSKNNLRVVKSFKDIPGVPLRISRKD